MDGERPNRRQAESRANDRDEPHALTSRNCMVATHTMEDILMEAAKSRRLDKLARCTARPKRSAECLRHGDVRLPLVKAASVMRRRRIVLRILRSRGASNCSKNQNAVQQKITNRVNSAPRLFEDPRILGRQFVNGNNRRAVHPCCRSR